MAHWIEKGSIMRTVTRSSLGFLVRGTSWGSKSAGMYLLRTLRSPIFTNWVVGVDGAQCFSFGAMQIYLLGQNR